jgi:hypothetical protein
MRDALQEIGQRRTSPLDAARAGRCFLCGSLGGGYDVVYYCDLLDHFAEPVATLGRMRTLLAPGGLLYFEVGLLGGLAPSWFRWIREVGLPHYRWFYSLDAVRHLLAYAGLELVATQRFGLAPMVGLTCIERALAPGLRSRWPWKRRIPDATTPDHGPHEGTTMATPPLSFRELAHAGHGYLESLLRYRVGALTPPVGPSTLLALARPVLAPGGVP